MDNNTTTQTTINPNNRVDPLTGWHTNEDGIALHRNTIINELRSVGYLASVSISVPDLRTLHATTIAAYLAGQPVAKPAARTKAVTPAPAPVEVDKTSPEYKRSLKNLQAAARRKEKKLAAQAAA